MSVTFIDIKSNLRIFPYSTPVPTSVMGTFPVDTGATPDEYQSSSAALAALATTIEAASQQAQQALSLDAVLQKIKTLDSSSLKQLAQSLGISNEADIASAISSLSADALKNFSNFLGVDSGTSTTTSSGDSWQRASFQGISGLEKLVKPIESGFTKLNAVIQVLTKVLKIIELVLSAFGSFSSLIRSIIDIAQKKLNTFVEGSMSLGVYINAVAPPGLMPKFSTDADSAAQTCGGFNGFLSRLDGSINNSSDSHRPPFTASDYVGGLLLVVDSESPDEIWTGLKQLYNVFDFVGGFGISIEPPPPENIKAVCSLFQTDPNSTTAKLGIQLDWKNNYLTAGYLVSRSTVAGGVREVETYIPTHLMDNKQTGERGMISVMKDQISKIFGQHPPPPPTREVWKYNDNTFNGGQPVWVGAGLLQTVSFVDTFVDPQAKTPYYYVIQACSRSKLIKGTYSTEIAVTVKTCNDAGNFADVIEQPGGRFEFISKGGAMKVNTWSSIQINMLIPWFGEIIKMMNNVLDTIKGMFTNVSGSFADFINQIKTKIEMFMGVLQTISMLLTSLKGLILGPSIAMLNLVPAKGGMSVFMDRVRSATVPPTRPVVIHNFDGTETTVTVPGFSGPTGMTIGFVMVYGGPGAVVTPISKAFALINKLFTKK
jgi:hypothetical protein